MKTGDSAYFVDAKGKVLKYTIVEKKGRAPYKGCDFLIEDKNGFIYSGSSKSYFESKEIALRNAKETYLRYIKQTKEDLQSEERVLKIIKTQLDLLTNLN